jgi:2-iminobutanoate/2-iminopropanoate deaminase
MTKRVIKTGAAPSAIGPYSQGLRHGTQIFLSGQIAIDPRSGEVVSGSVEDETAQVLKNLRSVLAEAGAALEDVVKTTVFLTDLADFDGMNGVYSKFFREPYPARSTVEVKALPKGVRVEIDAVAIVGS